MVSQSIGASPAHWADGVVAIPISDNVPPHNVVVASIREARLTHRAQAFRNFCLSRQTQNPAHLAK